ncbi:hypothetical protein EV44_g3822 [Erysiphe necator]|uniref:Integrase catalytic domain-containing protein n=1 Tax=Uncinula necator TaxID=52586 RepID=A0A0B1P444_UNCNE|nr:hypothetical protein EV44_g3822 [Erysiphe necator]
MTSQHVWNMLRLCWIDVYLGSPDIITHDAGSNFSSKEFRQTAKSLAIEIKEIPVKSANSMSIVERYHKPLRLAYEIIKEEIDTNNTEEQKSFVLQMAVKAAYTQSKSHLAREFYVRPPKELKLPAETLLKVLRPLYGVPEAGTHWFRTYHDHHIYNLDLEPSSYDPCLLFSHEAIVGLQTDDTIAACNTEFRHKEEEELQRAKFDAMPIQKLTINSPININGAHISLLDTTISVTQHDQISKISILKDYSKHDYVSQRARGDRIWIF